MLVNAPCVAPPGSPTLTSKPVQVVAAQNGAYSAGLVDVHDEPQGLGALLQPLVLSHVSAVH